MDPASDTATADEGGITVRVHYWASARAAAGVDAEDVPLRAGATLSELYAVVRAERDDRFARVLACCSTLVDERPASSGDPDRVVLAPGARVDLLPPFAGGA